MSRFGPASQGRMTSAQFGNTDVLPKNGRSEMKDQNLDFLDEVFMYLNVTLCTTDVPLDLT